MQREDEHVAYSLTMPPADPLREDGRYAYWLKLADMALVAAREEQERIKEKIKPQIDRYRKITQQRQRQKAA